MNSPEKTLAISGAGIGGLAAGLAASQAGYQVKIFEKTAQFTEVGAGIQMGPNVWKCLHALGIGEEVREWASFPSSIQARSLSHNKLLGELVLDAQFQKKYGAPYSTIHRADLHHILAKAARENAGIELHLGTAVHHLKEGNEDTLIHLAGDRENYLGGFDGLIVADGVWSELRQQILHDGMPKFTGHIAYRGLIRQSALPEQLRSQNIITWLGPSLHAVLYPVRRAEFLNMVVVFEKPDRITIPSDPRNRWDFEAPANPLDLLQKKAPVNGQLQQMLEAINVHGTTHEGAPWRMWPLYGRPPIRRPQEMAQHNIALLGDAAHPMLPYLAQGAAMAIEDALVLKSTLAEPEKTMEYALRQYALKRYARNAKVQKKSIRNGKIFHLSGPMRLGRDLSMQLLAKQLMDSQWLYSGLE